VNTLLAVQPDHPAIPELVRTLADAGRRGEWRSTQDVAFAVMALGHYLRQNKAAVPFDAAQRLLDGKALAEASAPPLVWSASARLATSGPRQTSPTSASPTAASRCSTTASCSSATCRAPSRGVTSTSPAP